MCTKKSLFSVSLKTAGDLNLGGNFTVEEGGVVLEKCYSNVRL